MMKVVKQQQQQQCQQDENTLQIPYFSKYQQGDMFADLDNKIESEADDADSYNFSMQRVLFPKQKQFVFNGVHFYNLGDQIDLNEFIQQFMTSDNFQVRQIEKRKQFLSVELIQGFYNQSDYESQEYRFEHALHILQQSQDEQKHQLGEVMMKLKQYCMEYSRHIDVVNIFYQYNPSQLIMIKHLRIMHMRRLSQSIKDSLFTIDDYVLTLHFTPLFDKKIQSIESYDVNLPFVELLGTTEEQFISISMRNGFQCWLGERSCEEFQNQITQSLIQNKNINDIQLRDQELITLDGIVVKSNLRFIFVQNMWDLTHPFMPVTLHPSLDSFVILQYQIQQTHIDALRDIRQQQLQQSSIINTLTQSISYSIQSEIFFDKFYKNQSNNLLKKSTLLNTNMELEQNQQQ